MKITGLLICAAVSGGLLVSASITPAAAQGRMRGNGRQMGRMQGGRGQGGMMGRGQGGMMGRGQGGMMGIPGLQDHPLTAEQSRRIARIREDGRRQKRTDTHERVMNELTAEQKAEFRSWNSGPGKMGGQRTGRGGRGMSGQQGGMMGNMGSGAGMGRRMGNGMGRGQGAMMGIPGLQDHPLTAEQSRRIARIREDGRRQKRTDTHERVMNELTAEQKAEFRRWNSAHAGSGS